MALQDLLLCIILCSHSISSTSPELEPVVNNPRHLKPFGYTTNEPIVSVDEIEGFPFTHQFFKDYVIGSKPVLMKNAAKLSKAFELWSDEYFLNVDEPAESQVLVEARKKEDRDAPASYMSFKDYVRIYNTTDQYMVNTVPSCIMSDVVLPTPLQCDPIRDGTLADAVMWFSSGGTKSVVHTDSVDNINCLFRGQKQLVFVDPVKYGDNVDIDRPEGAFSQVDVDRVDLTKYPGLADVEYLHVSMTPGDCLYIPYKCQDNGSLLRELRSCYCPAATCTNGIHQVRSTGSNIAVNVWWDYHVARDLDLSSCEDKHNPDITLDKVQLSGFGYEAQNIHVLKDQFKDFTRKNGLDFTMLLKMVVQDVESINQLDTGRRYEVPIRQVFDILDKNKDANISTHEVDNATDEDWEFIMGAVQEFEELMKEAGGSVDDMDDSMEGWTTEDQEAEYHKQRRVDEL